MRYAALVLLACCATPIDPERPDEMGRASDPTFCVNVERDGRRYTANDAPPTPEQSAAGVEQGRYPWPAHCVYVP